MLFFSKYTSFFAINFQVMYYMHFFYTYPLQFRFKQGPSD